MTYPPYNQYPPQGPPPPPGYGHGYYGPPKDNTAMTAFILALAGLACCITWFVAIPMGHIALGKMKRGEADPSQRGFAIAALWISYGLIAVNIALIALGVTAGILEGLNT